MLVWIVHVSLGHKQNWAEMILLTVFRCKKSSAGFPQILCQRISKTNFYFLTRRNAEMQQPINKSPLSGVRGKHSRGRRWILFLAIQHWQTFFDTFLLRTKCQGRDVGRCVCHLEKSTRASDAAGPKNLLRLGCAWKKVKPASNAWQNAFAVL